MLHGQPLNTAREIYTYNELFRANNAESTGIGSEVIQAQRSRLDMTTSQTVGGSIAVTPNESSTFEQPSIQPDGSVTPLMPKPSPAFKQVT